MTQPEQATIKLSPLSAQHRALGARMIRSADWEMPEEFSDRSTEHLAVRGAAGLFDLSHMGQIEVAGKDALAAIQWLTCTDASQLEPGQSHYTGLMTPAGKFVDDLRVYRLGQQHFLLVVNAQNVDTDFAWILEHTRHLGDVTAYNASSRYALLALQGPVAAEIIQRVTNFDLSGIECNWFGHGEVAKIRATISRTGFTGEDGYEVLVPPKQAPVVWNAILESGEAEGVIPAGLGARDTLRLEAALRLHGHDIDADTTVLEADLDVIIGWTKLDFVGRDTLLRQKEAGVTRRLVGFEMMDGAVVDHGCPVVLDGHTVGVVTSGAEAPFLKKSIGMAYVPASHTAEGVEFEVMMGGQLSRARVVRLPFYKRPKG